MKRILTLVLAVLMLVSAFAACGGDTGDVNETPAASDSQGTHNALESTPGESRVESTPANGSQESTQGNTPESPSESTPGESHVESTPAGESNTTPSAPETEELGSGISDDIDYGGDEVYIMHWKAYNPEFVVDDQADMGDPIYSAIEKKNLYTEEALNVTLDFTEVLGDGGGPQPFIDALKNRMSDPSTPVDIMAAYARTTAMTTLEGLLCDLTPFENLDFSREWWPKDMQDEYNINGRLYFISGDISSNLLLMMYGVYYNKDMLEAYGRENPVELVKSDEWTIDAFIEMSSDVYENLDGSEESAIYGLACSYWDFDAVYHASGYGLVDRAADGDDIVKFSDELFSSIGDAYITKLSKWVTSSDVVSETDYSGKAKKAFREGRSMFTISAASIGFDLRDADINYGAVPMPKLDPGAQERYVTCLANPFSLYGMCTVSRDQEKSAATLQTLGYYAYQYTTPAVYDITMKGKFSKDEDTMAMWELMREGISFDLGRIYHTQLKGICDVVSMAITTGKQWSVECSGPIYKGRLNSMRILNNKLRELS